MRKVLVTYGGATAFENSLDEALDKVFGATGSTPPPDTGTTTPPDTATGSGDPEVQQALKDAQKAFDDGQAALRKSPIDWEAYGKAQKDLQSALQRAQQAQARAQQQGSSGAGGEKSGG